MPNDKRPSVKNDEQYEALRDQGYIPTSKWFGITDATVSTGSNLLRVRYILTEVIGVNPKLLRVKYSKEKAARIANADNPGKKGGKADKYEERTKE